MPSSTAIQRCEFCHTPIAEGEPDQTEADQTQFGGGSGPTHASCLGAKARQLCAEMNRELDFQPLLTVLVSPTNLQLENTQQRLFTLGLLVGGLASDTSSGEERPLLNKLISTTNVLTDLSSSAIRTQLNEMMTTQTQSQAAQSALIEGDSIGLSIHSSTAPKPCRPVLELDSDESAALVEALGDELEDWDENPSPPQEQIQTNP